MTTARSEETERLAALLGGRRVFRRDVRDKEALLKLLKRGFPYAAMEALLVEFLELHHSELPALLGVSARSLARRKEARRLSPAESDRLYRVAHVAQLAEAVLGTRELAKAWLTRPNKALGGAVPVTLLDTEIGVRRVEELLLRIDHGIYS